MFSTFNQSYCSNAARTPRLHLFFVCVCQGRATWWQKMISSHRAPIQHVIVPHIRGHRKAIHMQMPISLCTVKTTRKNSKFASQTPEHVGVHVSDNTDVMWWEHQTSPESVRKEGNVNQAVWARASCEDQTERQDNTRHLPTFLFWSSFTFCSDNAFDCEAAMCIKWNAATQVESAAKMSQRQLWAI